MAVCRAWREALSDLPLAHLELRSQEEDMSICRWAILTQPCVLELELCSNLELAVQAVHSLRRKVNFQYQWPCAVELHGVLPGFISSGLL